jgi:hypothetical protein
MKPNYQYYYNNVPNEGLCRNNLVYTSLINQSKTEFVQWFYNDSEYHKGQNEVVDAALMEQKWQREVDMLLTMYHNFPEHVPDILEFDYQVHTTSGIIYNNGLITFTDWDIIENDLILRQKSLLQTERDRVVAEAAWEQVQGLGVIP